MELEKFATPMIQCDFVCFNVSVLKMSFYRQIFFPLRKKLENEEEGKEEEEEKEDEDEKSVLRNRSWYSNGKDGFQI